MSNPRLLEFVAQLRSTERAGQQLTWPAAISVEVHRTLACDVLERALWLGEEMSLIPMVSMVRRSLRGDVDPKVLAAMVDRLWEQIPGRGLYPNVSGEPKAENRAAWAVASLADPRSYSEVFEDAVDIAVAATVRRARAAVFDASRAGRISEQSPAAILAWRAAIEVAGPEALRDGSAEIARSNVFGAPVIDQWECALAYRAWLAETTWQNWFIANQLERRAHDRVLAPAPRVVAVGVTDKGHRSHDEDAFIADIEKSLFVVADGMGGGGFSGLPAAQLAVATVGQVEILPNSATSPLEQVIRAANWRIWSQGEAARRARDAGKGDLGWIGAGATIVALHLARGRAFVSHVGDARAYRWRRGVLEPLTRDHVHQLPVPIVTHILGAREQVEVESIESIAGPGDIFLLCSDGLTNVLGDREVAAIIGEFEHDLAGCCRMLVARAIELGKGRDVRTADNITVVLVQVPSASL